MEIFFTINYVVVECIARTRFPWLHFTEHVRFVLDCPYGESITFPVLIIFIFILKKLKTLLGLNCEFDVVEWKWILQRVCNIFRWILWSYDEFSTNFGSGGLAAKRKSWASMSKYRVLVTGVQCICGNVKLVNEKGGQKNKNENYKHFHVVSKNNGDVKN